MSSDQLKIGIQYYNFYDRPNRFLKPVRSPLNT